MVELLRNFWRGRIFSPLHGLSNLFLDLLAERREGIIIDVALRKEEVAQFSDWITSLVNLLLIARAVLSRVRHRMALEAVCPNVNESWSR